MSDSLHAIQAKATLLARGDTLSKFSGPLSLSSLESSSAYPPTFHRRPFAKLQWRFVRHRTGLLVPLMNNTGSPASSIPFASQPRSSRLLLLLLVLLTGGLWLSSRAVLSANFLPHWYCFAGNARVLWTTVIADLLIGLSYVAISATLAFIVRRAGRDLPYQGFFWAFGLFIVSCGVTHFFEILTVWKPVYWLSAAAKIITAVASVGTAVVLLIAAGDIIAFVLTARQLAKRRGDEKFRALFNAAPLAVLSLDLEGLVTSWNPAAEKIFGFSEREVIGQGLPIVPAAFREEHRRLLKTSLAGSATIAFETIRQRSDGSRLPVNAYAAPLNDENGKRIGIMAAIEDISGRKRMELDLQEKTDILSAVAHALNVYLENGNWNLACRELLSFVIGKTSSEYGFLGVILDDGTLRVLGLDGSVRDEPLNRTRYEDTLRRLREEGSLKSSSLQELFAQVLFSGQLVVCNQCTETHSAGAPVAYPPLHSFLGVPILRASDVAGFIAIANRTSGYSGNEWEPLATMSHAVGVLFDNYKQLLKRAALEVNQAALEEQVRRAQKMEVLGRLAGGVAHDFNNMLMVLSGSAELLDRSFPPDALSRIYLDQIQRTITKAAAITRQLLAFSRKQILDIKPMDLHVALQESLNMLPTLLGTDVRITFAPGAQDPWIRSDIQQMEQVIVNLAINARDAMPQGGVVTISTRNATAAPASVPIASKTPSNWVVLEVADTGTGMDSQTLAHIFEPFFTTKPSGKGTGLGLATVYGIVRQSGGHIDVESAPGQGARFLLHFPVTERPRQETQGLSRSSPAKARADATLLLVDDEASLRHALAEILRDSGYSILEAPSSQDALQIARDYPGAIDLLVTDVVMPGLRGPELYQRILALQPRIRVLFMSGYAEDLPETQLPQGTTFLQKPFSFAALLESLRSLRSTN